MSVLYKRIHELESELALSLAHNLAVDKSGNAKATKITITELYNILMPQIIAQLKADGQIATAGNIKSHGSNTLPDGWLWCDNVSYERVGTYADLFADIGTTWGSVDGAHFNVPDFRGIALMGAGSSAKLDDANGAAFARVLGTYQNDKIQGHKHSVTHDAQQKNSLTGVGGTGKPNPADATIAVGNPTTDEVNGTPRTGTETNPANAGVNFIIKY